MRARAAANELRNASSFAARVPLPPPPPPGWASAGKKGRGLEC